MSHRRRNFLVSYQTEKMPKRRRKRLFRFFVKNRIFLSKIEFFCQKSKMFTNKNRNNCQTKFDFIKHRFLCTTFDIKNRNFFIKFFLSKNGSFCQNRIFYLFYFLMLPFSVESSTNTVCSSNEKVGPSLFTVFPHQSVWW